MSHLPPRPDFAEPTSRRPDSRTHYYGARPMAPEHAYPHPPPRERERDVYVARSPPRSRHAPHMADSYVASDRERDRDREAYREPYADRRDDDRHRHAFRDRERRERDRDSYAPPPPPASADYRHREDSRAWPPRDTRDSRDRGRNWDPRPWTQSSEIDRRPRGLRQREVVEGERRWESRPARSPPPRAYPPRRERSSSRTRSPRRRSPSLEPRRSSPFSPRRRPIRSPPRSSLDMRANRRSRSPSPRRGGTSPAKSHTLDMKSRRSASPRRGFSTRGAGSQSGRSPRSVAHSPPRRRSRSRSRSPRRSPPRAPDTSKPSRRSSPRPSAKPAITRRSPSPRRQDEGPPQVKSPVVVAPPPVKEDVKAKSPSTQPSNESALDSPNLQSLPHALGVAKSPATPISPQAKSPLPGLPEKPSSVPLTQPEPAPPSAGPPPIPDFPPGEFALTLKRAVEALPDSDKKEFEFKPDPALRELSVQMEMVSAHQAHLETSYYTTAKEARKAMRELHLSHMELSTAEERRKLADAQLELAMDGSYDFKPGNPYTAKWESLDEQAVAT